MINVSTDFKRSVFNGNNNFLIRLSITLQDGTKLEVENNNIMSNGLLVDDAVSDDDDFTALGSTIINACDVILYNNDNVYSDYEFKNARVVVYIGLNINGTIEEFKRGVFTVDDAVYGDVTITLSLLDNTAQFDRPYSESSLVYPATLLDIVLDACSVCDVTFATNSLRFPHNTFNVVAKPSGESTTFREVIGWAATIAGCFARCNTEGELEFKWFDVSALESAQDTAYDGGTFNPWTEGNVVDGGSFTDWSGTTVDGGSFQVSNNVHYINALRSQTLGVDDTVITGIRISVEIDDPESDEDIVQVTAGTDDYLIEIEDNKLITVENMSTVLNWLSTQLIGLRFRKCNIETLGNPIIEAGDVALIWDSKGVEHPILVTRATFSPTSLQEIVCGSAQVTRNSVTRFSNQTKSYVAMRKQLRQQRETYDAALADLSDRVANANGLYKTEVTQQDGSTITYYHSKPQLSDSDIQIIISSTGVTVTSNGTAEHPTWYGLEVDGNLIASIMNTIGINFDWGVGGELIIKKGNTETLYVNAATGEVRINATTFSLTSGATIDSIAQGKADSALQSANTYTDTAKQDAISTASSDATNKANNAVTSANSYTDSQLNDYSAEVNAIVANLQDQIDGQIESWYYDYEPTLNNLPASDWTTADDKKAHEGDIFFWKSKGYAYRFMQVNSTWSWTLIQDSEITRAIGLAESAQTTANAKRRVFVAQPTTPYEVGDLWVQGSTGDILRCSNSRATGSYTASDWVKASKYTDDSAVTALDNSLTQQEVFNRLTNNGQAQGIFLEADGKLYVNAEYLVTGQISDANNLSYWNLITGDMSLTGTLTIKTNNMLFNAGSITYKSIFISTVTGSITISTPTKDGIQARYTNNDSPLSKIALIPFETGTVLYSAPDSGFTGKTFTSHRIAQSVTNGVTYALDEYLSSYYTLCIADITNSTSIGYISLSAAEIQLSAGKGKNIKLVVESNRFGVYTGTGDAPGMSLDTSSLVIISAGKKLLGGANSTYLSWGGKNLAYVSSSSRRYKREIEELKDDTLNPHKLYDLKTKQFKYKENTLLQYPDMEDKLIPGFIAEEVAEVYPSAVIYNDDGQIESWDERRIIPGMLSLIQEQKQKIDELEERIARLEKLLLKED